MRLIDADKAIAAVEWGITRATLINIETGEKTHPFDATNEELQKAVARIKKLPAFEPTRGMWTRSYYFGYADYVCSVCGNHRDHETNFCENCGAEMERWDG